MAPTAPRFSIDLDAYRKQAGISILALSDLTGIPRTSLRRKIKNPGQFTLDEFARVRAVLSIPDGTIS